MRYGGVFIQAPPQVLGPSGQRSSARYTRTNRFQASLAAPPAAAAASAGYVVQKGDNLTRIVRARLVSTGATPSNHDVYQGVRRVAAANGLANPDIIHPGQRLDLSAAQPAAGGAGGPAPVLPERLQAPDLAALLRNVRETRRETKAALAQPWSRAIDGPATLSSGYGIRKDPFSGRPAFHHGIDLAADRGAQVRAIRPGTVTFSGSKGGYGRMVIVRHADGLESIYAHNERNLVQVGDHVNGSSVIGEVGSSGRSTGPHLHLEIRKDGRRVNPMPYLESPSLR